MKLQGLRRFTVISIKPQRAETTLLNWSYPYIHTEYISLFTCNNSRVILLFLLLFFQLKLDQFNVSCAQIHMGFYLSPYFLFSASKWSVLIFIPELSWGIKIKLTCMHNSLASSLPILFFLLAKQYHINNRVSYFRLRLIIQKAH